MIFCTPPVSLADFCFRPVDGPTLALCIEELDLRIEDEQQDEIFAAIVEELGPGPPTVLKDAPAEPEAEEGAEEMDVDKDGEGGSAA